MQYKTIQELYLSLGVAGAIIVVFLGVFVFTVIQNDKRRNREFEKMIEKIDGLQTNDTNFQMAIEKLSEAIKELSTSNRVIVDIVGRLDYYNKDLNKKLDKHDEKCDKILDSIRR